MSTTTLAAPHRQLVARHLLRTQLVGLEVLLAGFMLVVALIAWIIHAFGGLESGIWSGAVQFLRWFAIGFGVYLSAVYLPLYVAHGRTRREIAVGELVFAICLAAWLGIATLVGFAVEAGIYHLLGWEAFLADPHPLRSVPSGLEAFVLHGTTFLTYTVIGALGGAAFYRSILLGIAVVPPGLLLLGTSTVLIDSDDLTEIPWIGEMVPSDPGLLTSVLVNLAIAAVVAGGTRLITRDIPLRNR